MAIICTNNLTGSNTTGTGATSAPYKTIMFALAGATSGDEIRVAGGQWVAIGGTGYSFTFTQGSSTIATSTSVVGQIAALDFFTFVDPDYGFGKVQPVLETVSTGSINLWSLNPWTGSTFTVDTIYKASAVHYTGASPESFNSSATLPNGRTNIKIIGGWNDDFSSNANGWTFWKGTAVNQALFGSTTFPGMGRWADNLIIDKFSCIDGSPILMGGTANPQGISCAYGEINITGYQGDSAKIVRNTSTTNLAAIWNPPGEISKLYQYGPCTRNEIINSPSYEEIYGATGLSPTKWDLDIWITPGSNNSGFTYVPTGFTFNGGGSNIRNQNVHWRSDIASGVAKYKNPIGSSCYIENLKIYTQTPAFYPLFPTNLAYSGLQIFNIEFYGPGATASSIQLGTQNSQTLIKLTGKTIEDVNPGFGTVLSNFAFETTLAKVCESYLAPTQVQDTDGYKTLDLNATVYFKDNVNNWLSVKAPRVSAGAGTYPVWSVLGVLDKPQQPFTLTVVLKISGGTWNSIGIQYGPQISQVYTQAISPTTSFATYTMTVDPATFPDWNTFIYPLFIGINENMPSVLLEEPDIYCYVQSLTIT